MAIAVWTSFQQIADSNGVPYNGAKVNVYAAGTTTPLTVYSDSGLTTPVANPIICDSAGQHAMRYIATASYKTSITDSSDNALSGWSKDNIDPGVAVGSGALPVANGGTAGTTAAAARTNLAAAAATDMATAQSDISNLQTWAGYTLTTGTRLASGTTAQAPAAGTAGKIRWDTTLVQPTIDNGSAWKNIPIAGKLDATYFTASTALICVKRSRTTVTSSQTITSSIPQDGTIPQIGEGTEITGFNVNFTPLYSTTTLRVRALIRFGTSAANPLNVFAMFINSATDAVVSDVIYPNVAAVKDFWMLLEYEYAPGSVSAQNVQIRAGTSTGSLYINSDSNTVTLGATRLSSLIIEEWYTA